jgi:hypothetical protein
MKTTQIIIRFDAAKLKALEYYLPQNGTTVEDELNNRLEEIYKNQVPDNVKDFIGFQSGSVDFSDSQTENAPEQNEDADEPSKPSRRQKASSPKAEAAQSEAPGMTLNM